MVKIFRETWDSPFSFVVRHFDLLIRERAREYIPQTVDRHKRIKEKATRGEQKKEMRYKFEMTYTLFIILCELLFACRLLIGNVQKAR